MKRFISLLAALSLALAPSCGSHNEDFNNGNGNGNGNNNGNGNGNGGTEKPAYEIVFDGDGSTPAPVIEARGGSATIGFTSAAEWSAAKAAEADWLTLSPATGSAGHGQITVTAAASTSHDQRNASVVITSGSVEKRFTVTQKQLDALTATSKKVELPVEGGEFQIKLLTNLGSVEVEIEPSAAEWITPSAATYGLESRVLRFNAAENPSTRSREGRIVLSAGTLTETVTVYQSGVEPCMILTDKEFTVPAEGGEVRIELQSNIGVEVEEPAEEWIHSLTTRAMSYYTYIYLIDENSGTESRKAQIVFTGTDSSLSETVTVTQKQRDALTLTADRFEIEAAGGRIELELQTNLGDVEFSIDESASEWLSAVEDTRAMENRTLAFEAAPNESFDPREGHITLRAGALSETVTVVQLQQELLTTDTTRIELEAEEAEFSIGLSTSLNDIEVEFDESAAAWLHTVLPTRAVENRTLHFLADRNRSLDKREGTIILRAGSLAQSIKVTQQGTEPFIAIAQSDYVVAAAGGTLTVEVESNVDIEVMNFYDWVTLDSSDEEGIDKRYTFTFGPNPDDRMRSATISFLGSANSLRASITADQQWIVTSDSFKWPNNEASDGILRAFPGAEGGGMYTTGGRGGRVIHVTNLNDSGPGSLRDAVRQSGPRTVVFDVAGTIALESQLTINNGDLTIAGQTAPGYGICIKDCTVQVNADNVIIRYVRFRLGDKSANDPTPQEDCIWGRYHTNIILDHCSMTWSIDECASFYANRNFTMQWCLVGESLNSSGHEKGEHGYGGLWGGRNASFHHNLITCNKSRNARLDHPQIYADEGKPGAISTHRGNVDYRNNVVYNWFEQPTHGGEDGRFNMVNNYAKPGPASATRNRKYFMQANSYYKDKGANIVYKYPRLYLEGNVHSVYGFADDQQRGVSLCDEAFYRDEYVGEVEGDDKGDAANMFLSKPLPIRSDDVLTCYTTTHPTEELLPLIVNYVGASLRRDRVDRHITEDARNGTASYTGSSDNHWPGIIDSQRDVGGWPELTATQRELSRTLDTDGDGIPDFYEAVMGLDAGDASDGAGHKFDSRYTNLEMYLHYLVQETTVNQTQGGINQPLD